MKRRRAREAHQASPQAGEQRGAGSGDLQDLIGNAAVQQLVGGRAREAAFERGAEGPTTALPHRARLDEAFGMDLGDVDVHQGPEVDEALHRMGARGAYAAGTMLLEQGAPLEVVAHAADEEASGVALKRGGAVSMPGDPSERRADAMAGAVARGRPAAEGLVGAGLGRAPAGEPGVVHGWWLSGGEQEEAGNDRPGTSRASSTTWPARTPPCSRC